jgi:hypothetical protein
MPAIFTIAGLGLLLWAAPAPAREASAIKVHPITVSIHDSLPSVDRSKVEKVLGDASKLLQEENGCKVKFKLDGPITRLPRGAPIDISNEDQLEAVHREAADLKIVETITFCMGEFREQGFVGCAWRPEGRRPKSMIIPRFWLVRAPNRHIILAHEFGHTTGLQHRAGQQVLMTPDKIGKGNVKITERECECFEKGRGGCDD